MLWSSRVISKMSEIHNHAGAHASAPRYAQPLMRAAVSLIITYLPSRGKGSGVGYVRYARGTRSRDAQRATSSRATAQALSLVRSPPIQSVPLPFSRWSLCSGERHSPYQAVLSNIYAAVPDGARDFCRKRARGRGSASVSEYAWFMVHASFDSWRASSWNSLSLSIPRTRSLLPLVLLTALSLCPVSFA